MPCRCVLSAQVLFQGTIESNIRDGKPGATEAEVLAAAEAANALDFINSFPDKLQTQVRVGPGRRLRWSSYEESS
jgi:ABC-type multidrug transport system fused ATPase/permease subunit